MLCECTDHISVLVPNLHSDTYTDPNPHFEFDQQNKSTVEVSLPGLTRVVTYSELSPLILTPKLRKERNKKEP